MSERGSYMTQFIYNDQDRQTILDYLKEFTEQAKPHISLTVMTDGRMIAGTIRAGGGYPGEEGIAMEYEILPGLKGKLNSPVKFAVITDSGEHCTFVVEGREMTQEA